MQRTHRVIFKRARKFTLKRSEVNATQKARLTRDSRRGAKLRPPRYCDKLNYSFQLKSRTRRDMTRKKRPCEMRRE